MLNMYVGKNIVKVDETDLLGMDINVLKGIPYNVASKYADYISAIEVCVEDCLDIPTDIKDEASYLIALAELESIIKEDEVMDASNTKLNKVENKKEEVIMNGSNVTIETVNEKEMVSMMEDVAKEMNGEAKGFDKVKEAINNFRAAGRNTRKTVLHEAGVEKDAYINNVDESFNTLKETFMDVITAIGNITGFSYLKKDIITIIEVSTDGQNSAEGFFRMARKCRELIDKEEKDILKYGNEKDIKRVITLKSLTENERGKSVFEAFASLCVWIGVRITEKFASWGAKHQENKVFSTICNSVAKVANLIREGVKLVWRTAKFIASYAIAGAIKLADIAFKAIRTLYSNIKCFIVDKIAPDYVDDFEDNDLDDDFFTDDEE